MYEYALVARVPESEPIQWQWKGPGEMPTGGLLSVLNRAGKEGWEVVAAADFGGSPTAEVLLKRSLGRTGPSSPPPAEPPGEHDDALPR